MKTLKFVLVAFFMGAIMTVFAQNNRMSEIGLGKVKVPEKSELGMQGGAVCQIEPDTLVNTTFGKKLVSELYRMLNLDDGWYVHEEKREGRGPIIKCTNNSSSSSVATPEELQEVILQMSKCCTVQQLVRSEILADSLYQVYMKDTTVQSIPNLKLIAKLKSLDMVLKSSSLEGKRK